MYSCILKFDDVVITVFACVVHMFIMGKCV